MNRKAELKSPKRKINPVDAVIGVVFLLALVSVIYLIVSIGLSDQTASGSEAGVMIEYRLQIEDIAVDRFNIALDETTGTAECDFLKIGDSLYNADGSAVIGKLTAVQYEATTGSTGKTDSEGNLIYAEYPGRVDLILTVRGELSDDSLTVGGESVRVGKQIDFHTSTYHAVAEVVSVDTEVE